MINYDLHFSTRTHQLKSKIIVFTFCFVVSVVLSQNLVAETFVSSPWQETTKSIGHYSHLPTGLLTKDELQELIDIGEALFAAKFTLTDGAGRPAATQAILPTKVRKQAENLFSRTSGSDANACVSCHNDPLPGGAGDFVTNVFVSEGFTIADFDSTDPQFSNERGTNHLFGAGLIELLAREMSAELIQLRSQALTQARKKNEPIRIPLETKGVSFGFLTTFPDGLVDLKEVEGIDNDLIVRPFSQKGVMTSLRQFTINALNHHHGMQASERFGERWTGEKDFDEDGRNNELAPADISALVAWQATLPAPVMEKTKNKKWHQAATKGQQFFNDIGCQSCHRSSLPLTSLSFSDPGPLDNAGTLQSNQVDKPAIYDLQLLKWAQQLPRNNNGEILVPLFGDLKRHKMTDRQVDDFGNELLSQRFVNRNIFMTAELWGVASTSPYGHRNDMTTLDQVIRAHGGASRQSRERYVNADQKQRSNLIAFLKLMVIQ